MRARLVGCVKMIREVVVYVLLVVLAVGYLHVRERISPKSVSLYEAPHPKIFSQCEFREYVHPYQPVPPGEVSLAWCESRRDQVPRLRLLAQHLRLVANHEKDLHDGVVANNFGVPLRLGYVRSRDVLMINPIVIGGQGKKYCVEYSEDGLRKLRVEGRYAVIRITSLDEETMTSRRELVFSGADSCVAQSLLDKMNGVVAHDALIY